MQQGTPSAGKQASTLHNRVVEGEDMVEAEADYTQVAETALADTEVDNCCWVDIALNSCYTSFLRLYANIYMFTAL